MRLHFAILIAALGLSACSGKGLRTLYSDSEGPDEFIVIPNREWQAPPTNSLPAPAPGAPNRADINPHADVAAALGGQYRGRTGQIPSQNAALVNHTNRYGGAENIRQTIANEDAEFRRRKGRLAQIKIGRADRYKEVYDRQAIEPYEVNRVYRNAGARTPSAPPLAE